MQTTLTVLLLSFVTLPSFSQGDTTYTSTSPFTLKIDSITGLPKLIFTSESGKAQPTIISRGNISLAVFNLKPSFVEGQIADLESDECGALRKRDRPTLQRLWAKDFTVEIKQSELVTNANPLPHYLSFVRLIDKITVIDSGTVFTSGYETFQQFTTGVNTTPVTIRKYFHAWTRVNGLWKLTTKKHQ